MKFVLTGAAGKMGRAVLKILPSFQGVSLFAAIGEKGDPALGKPIFRNIKLESDVSKFIEGCDCVVDFTNPAASTINLKLASAAKKPIVIGTTGHTADERAHILSASKVIPIVFSPNMSIGVNTMWKLIEIASGLLGKDYKVDIVETHHVHKKDSPSGTAKKMLEIVTDAGGKAEIKSIREGEVVGNHTITFSSPYEQLEITHRALSREVFAAGAIRAALWVVGKPAGLYDMENVLGM